MYTIIGATGHTGRVISEALLARGRSVRAIGRDAERLEPLVAKGAKAWVGSIEDVDFLTEAFSEVTAVYTLMPPQMHAPDVRAQQNRIGAVIAAALRQAAARYVVNLSSVGAHLPEGTGPVMGLRDQEKRLDLIAGINVLHLRPVSFMENLLGLIPMLRGAGVLGGPLRPDVAIPMIAARDVGKYAAQRLLRLDFVGHQTQELFGPRDLTMNEIAPVFGRALGRPELKYAFLPPEEVEKAMVARMGFSPDAARRLMEFERRLNDGRELAGGPRTPRNTTETSIEEFAAIFAAAYRQAEEMEPSAAPSGHSEF